MFHNHNKHLHILLPLGALAQSLSTIYIVHPDPLHVLRFLQYVVIFHRLKLDVLKLMSKLAFGIPLFSTEFLPQARHLCKQLESQKHVDETVFVNGSDLLLTWLKYINTTAALSPSGYSPWSIVLAPILATLMQPIRLAPPVIQWLDYSIIAKRHAGVTVMLGATSAFALGAFPLFCRTSPINQSEAPIHDWLAHRPLRQQELLLAFSSSSFRWFLWNSYASAAALVHEFKGGLSPACSCRVPDRALDGSIGYWGPLWKAQEESLCSLEAFLESSWRGLLGCYLVLPGEKVMKYLLHYQQEKMEYRQREGLPTSSSSSRSSQNPLPGPGCFWFVNRVPARLPKCQGLGPEEVMAEHVVTLQQLQLMVNVLLLLWPKGAGAATAGAASGAEGAAAAQLATGAAAAGTGRAADAEAVPGKVQETEEGSTGFRGKTEGAAAGEAAGTAGAAAAGPLERRSQQAAAGAVGDGQAAPAAHPAAAGAAAARGAAGGSRKTAPSAGVLHEPASEPSLTGKQLLLLAAMLQQALAEAKQKLMEAEEGNLLLQLLYRVLQDQQDLLMALNIMKVLASLEGALETVVTRGFHNLAEAAFASVVSHADPVSLGGTISWIWC